MTKYRKSSKGLGNYEVGYRRPPAETRFQPGKSGNPRGHPKGLKSIGTLLVQMLGRWITVQENGRQRRMRMQDVIVQGLVNDAARRDAHALRQLFALMDRYCGPDQQEADSASLLPDDQAIIEDFISSLQVHRNASKSETSKTEPQESKSDSEGAAALEKKNPDGD
jgi:hypothetical protein